MHKTSDSYIKDISNSKLANGEKHDCVVRALAAAFDMTYDDAHYIAKTLFNRPDGDGARMVSIAFKNLANASRTINDKTFKVLYKALISYEGSPTYVKKYNPLRVKTQPIVVRQMLERFPQGKYVVLVKGHAFALIDGSIVGNAKDYRAIRTKVLHLIQVL